MIMASRTGVPTGYFVAEAKGFAKISFATVALLYGSGRCLSRVGTSVCVQIAPDTAFPKAEPMLKVAKKRPVTTARFSCLVAACMDV
jgi:hypothetical protein